MRTSAIFLSRRRDSNSRPAEYKSAALAKLSYIGLWWRIICSYSFLLLNMLIELTSQQEFHFRLIPPSTTLTGCTSGRSRTGTSKCSQDFKSGVSTYSTTEAYAGYRLTCGAASITHLRCRTIKEDIHDFFIFYLRLPVFLAW